MMQKRWFIKKSPESTAVEAFRSELKIDRISAQLLLQRGISNYEEAESFFNPSLDELNDPFLMRDMDKAVDRLKEAVANREKILLFGDYDVDGTTAVALMYTFLRDIADVEFYIPDRYKEGYGLSRQGITYAAESGVKLMITLDCGIKSIDLIREAGTLGIETIVCDHHTPGKELPDAIVLDPKRSDCQYPYKELSGCGVAFKLLQGYVRASGTSENNLWPLLDFVALSIGADIVEVTGENRVLAYYGLQRLNNDPRPAFREIVKLAGKNFPLTLTDVVFTIAPRINAAGRLRTGKYAVELMISDNPQEIALLAEEIETDNRERRSLDEQITNEALSQISADISHPEKVTTVVWKEGWHKGVVGIVASRLIEHHYRPTIVLTEVNGLLTGSARSIEGVDLYEALNNLSHLLEQFGGHKHAAGLTLKRDNLQTFIMAFDNEVAGMITKEMLVEQQEIDLSIQFSEIFKPGENRMMVPELMKRLNRFEPHGPGNMKPVFTSKNVLSSEVRILKDKHLKVRLFQPDSDLALDAIGFNLADKEDAVAFGLPYEIAFTMDINKWNNRETLQLMLKDIRES